jgi:1-acyl-sn-glycerol-3-phosphate acyltransferase
LVYVVRYLLIALYTVVWGIPATLVAPFDRSGRAVCWIGRTWVSWILATCGIRVVAEGLENVDPHRPHVLMTNHQSAVDIGAILTTLPMETFHFVAKKELGWIPLFGWALAASPVGVMVDRGDNARAVASLQRAAERVRRGANVIIFPEGTRSPDGALRAFKSGGFHLAIQAQVPILPATVSGSQRITPKHSLRVESGTVKIRYGVPIPTKGLTSEDRQALKDRVRAAIRAGYDLALQGAPPERAHAARAPEHAA